MQKNNLAIILSGGTGSRFDISKPKQFYKGTKMNYAGLSKTKDRADLIAWLRTKSDSPVALP